MQAGENGKTFGSVTAKDIADELNKKGCSDITFKYVKKASNEGNSGMIHPDSKVSGGNNTFTEGNTYTITIISN